MQRRPEAQRDASRLAASVTRQRLTSDARRRQGATKTRGIRPFCMRLELEMGCPIQYKLRSLFIDSYDTSRHAKNANLALKTFSFFVLTISADKIGRDIGASFPPERSVGFKDTCRLLQAITGYCGLLWAIMGCYGLLWTTAVLWAIMGY